METTTNLSLKKPGYDDPADVQDLNDNFDTIDGAIKTLNDMKTKLTGTNEEILISDLNDATTTGLYYTANSASNRPADYCTVYVFANHSGTLSQLAIATISNRLFIRTRANGTWGDWKEYASKTSTPLVYSKGTFADVYLHGVTGYIANNGKNAELFIPLLVTQDLTAQGLNVTAFAASMRHVDGGYLGGASEANLLSYITSQLIHRQQGGIRIILTNNNGWGITNNTPLSGIVKITFTLS